MNVMNACLFFSARRYILAKVIERRVSLGFQAILMKISFTFITLKILYTIHQLHLLERNLISDIEITPNVFNP